LPDPASHLKLAITQLLNAGAVEDGRQIDYETLRTHPSYKQYQEALHTLADFDPATLEGREAQLAFWINLYNGLIIRAVIEEGIKTSVASNLLKLAWFFRRRRVVVGGQPLGFDHIEHGLLRANRGHPYLPGARFRPHDRPATWVIQPMEKRIHFALNCASRSCPPVNVYTAERLEHQLEAAARNFITSETQVDPAGKSICLSEILKWYAVDFGGQEGVLSFIQPYLPEESAAWINANRAALIVRYAPYDWQLNFKG
jgi:Protein of unknown function, DUF547